MHEITRWDERNEWLATRERIGFIGSSDTVALQNDIWTMELYQKHDGDLFEQEVIKAMRAYAKTIAREAFQNEVEECVADTAKVWARRLYESRYTEPMTDKLVKAEVQSYIKEQMSHKEMLDLIQGTVQAAVAECKDKTKQFAQTEVEKYLKGAVVMNAIHEEIKRVVPQAVLDALRGV